MTAKPNTRVNRRRFLTTAAALAFGQFTARQRTSLGAELKKRRSRIAEIERHEINPRYQQFNSRTLLRYHGYRLRARTVFIARTDDGLEGIGEAWGVGWPDAEQQKMYLGTSPFDWIGDTANLPINMAMYDLMGKTIGAPAWKLMGPRLRDSIPVAAWTVSQTPDAMAEEVRQAAGRGYRWLKYHVDQVQNVIDQTEAMQQAAPPGFRIHYDFNGDSHLEAIAPILRELEKFPVAARIEDPITTGDQDGYRKLRSEFRLPILLHHAPPKCLVEGTCDGYMAGHAAIGSALKTSAIAETVNLPFMLQQAGGTINQAFLAHEVSVMKMATIDHVNLCHLWREDVTRESMPVVDGKVKLPEGPGLGVTLDREKFAALKKRPRHKYQPFLIEIRYAGGPTIYTRHDPAQPGATDNLRFVHRLLGKKAPGPTPGYANKVRTRFIDQTDERFARMWEKTAKGLVVERK